MFPPSAPPPVAEPAVTGGFDPPWDAVVIAAAAVPAAAVAIPMPAAAAAALVVRTAGRPEKRDMRFPR
jgi:hypothetical protein